MFVACQMCDCNFSEFFEHQNHNYPSSIIYFNVRKNEKDQQMSLSAFSRRVLYFIAFKSWSHCRGNRWYSNSTKFKTSCFQYIQRVCHELILAYSICLVYRNCGYNSATVYIKSDALLQQLKKVICQGGLVAHISFTAWKIAEYKFSLTCSLSMLSTNISVERLIL